MNYNADKPIKTGSEDLLGRAFFSKQLAKALYECDASDGLVIGLFGEWGSGKTSVLNMTMNEIKNMGEESENEPLIVTFSPWNYSDKDNLISLFFRNLINHLDMPSNNKIKRKIGKVLTDYADCLDALSVLSPLGGILVNILKPIIKTQGANLMEVPNLDSTKEKLETILKGSNQKIVVVIDDIDRLTNSQIRDIFHLAKQVGNFPNIVYILSMDREIVCRALKEIHNIDGHEYLEKIIQIPFEIPKISKSKVHKYLFNQLDKIINDTSNDTIIDDSYWGRVFVNCVSPYIDNLRDINRLTNIFKFKYRALYQEVSVEDMIGITTLEVLEPKLYKWIYNNKDILCNSIRYNISRNKGTKVEYRERFYNEFKGININPDKSIRCISTLFPAFAKEIDEYQGVYQSNAESKKKMKICDDEKFDIYFRHDLDSVEVSRGTIKDCLFRFNEEELNAIIEGINQGGNIVYFLEEVQSLIDDIPYERISLIVSVVLSAQWKFKGETDAGLFTKTAYVLAIDLVEELLHRIRIEQERFELLYSILNDMDKNRVGAIAIILDRVKLFYEENQESVEAKALISFEQLQELENMYMLNIRGVIETELISNIVEFRFAFFLWEKLSKEETLEYFNKIARSNINILKFISALATRWHGTGGKGWRIESSDYEEYIPKDEVYNKIKNLNKSDLSEFTDIEKIKLATFTLNYRMNDIYPANEEQAQELVEQWECNGIIAGN
jgi:P-loop ATPase